MIGELRNNILCVMKERRWDVPDEDDDTNVIGYVEYPFDIETAEIVQIPFYKGRISASAIRCSLLRQFN
jgi:hypothetical protein